MNPERHRTARNLRPGDKIRYIADLVDSTQDVEGRVSRVRCRGHQCTVVLEDGQTFLLGAHQWVELVKSGPR